MVRGFAASLRRVKNDPQIVFYLLLADVFIPVRRPEREVNVLIIFIGAFGVFFH
jgi:hypothetical protein